MKRLLLGATLALVSGLLCARLASAKAPVEVNVTLSDFKVEMSATDLPAGTAVTYVIANKGAITHEMVLEKAGVVDEPLEFNGTEQEAEDIEPGTTRTIEWTIPDAGGYQLACHVPGHYEAGMKTAFTAAAVSAPAPAPAAAAPAAAAPAAAAPAANVAPQPTEMPKTGGAGDLAWAALGLLGLLAIGGGVALRRRKARL